MDYQANLPLYTLEGRGSEMYSLYSIRSVNFRCFYGFHAHCRGTQRVQSIQAKETKKQEI